MADNVIVDNGELTDFTVSADEAASGYVQRFKLAYSADGSDSHVEADADGLKVKLGTALPAGTNAIGKLAANSGVDIGDVDVATVAGDVTVVQPTSSSLKGEMKITDGTDIAPVDPTNGLAVDVKAAAALPTGDNTVGRVKLTDGTKVGTLRTCTDKDVINVAITKSDGGQVDTFGGSGGTSSTDGEDFTPGSELGTGAMGVYESSPSSVADGKLGHVGITAAREVKVSLTSTPLDKAHNSDDGNTYPVKVGVKAAGSSLPSVSDTYRANVPGDLHGRPLTAHISAGMQVWKVYSTTNLPTTAVDVWTPGSGKKIAITHMTISFGGTTDDEVAVWFGSSGDTAYSGGTDQPVFLGYFAPGTDSKPGAVLPPFVPMYCDTADYRLKVESLGSGGSTLHLVVYGYEF